MGPYDKPFSPQEYLMHYGVKGIKWGVRRYQNKDGTLTKAGKERYSQNQQDGVDSFLKSVGSKKVSELTGSVNEDLAIQAVTYVSAFAAVLAVKAVQNRMLRKGRMKELDRLNREKDIKDFDECPRLPRKMKAEESVKVTNPAWPFERRDMTCRRQKSVMDSFLMTFSKPLSIPLRSKWEEKSRGKPFSIRFRRPATGPMAI